MSSTQALETLEFLEQSATEQEHSNFLESIQKVAPSRLGHTTHCLFVNISKHLILEVGLDVAHSSEMLLPAYFNPPSPHYRNETYDTVIRQFSYNC